MSTRMTRRGTMSPDQTKAEAVSTPAPPAAATAAPSRKRAAETSPPARRATRSTTTRQTRASTGAVGKPATALSVMPRATPETPVSEAPAAHTAPPAADKITDLVAPAASTKRLRRSTRRQASVPAGSPPNTRSRRRTTSTTPEISPTPPAEPRPTLETEQLSAPSQPATADWQMSGASAVVVKGTDDVGSVIPVQPAVPDVSDQVHVQPAVPDVSDQVHVQPALPDVSDQVHVQSVSDTQPVRVDVAVLYVDGIALGAATSPTTTQPATHADCQVTALRVAEGNDDNASGSTVDTMRDNAPRDSSGDHPPICQRPEDQASPPAPGNSLVPAVHAAMTDAAPVADSQQQQQTASPSGLTQHAQHSLSDDTPLAASALPTDLDRCASPLDVLHPHVPSVFIRSPLHSTLPSPAHASPASPPPTLSPTPAQVSPQHSDMPALFNHHHHHSSQPSETPSSPPGPACAHTPHSVHGLDRTHPPCVMSVDIQRRQAAASKVLQDMSGTSWFQLRGMITENADSQVSMQQHHAASHDNARLQSILDGALMVCGQLPSSRPATLAVGVLLHSMRARFAAWDDCSLVPPVPPPLATVPPLTHDHVWVVPMSVEGDGGSAFAVNDSAAGLPAPSTDVIKIEAIDEEAQGALSLRPSVLSHAWRESSDRRAPYFSSWHNPTAHGGAGHEGDGEDWLSALPRVPHNTSGPHSVLSADSIDMSGSGLAPHHVMTTCVPVTVVPGQQGHGQQGGRSRTLQRTASSASQGSDIGDADAGVRRRRTAAHWGSHLQRSHGTGADRGRGGGHEVLVGGDSEARHGRKVSDVDTPPPPLPLPPPPPVQAVGIRRDEQDAPAARRDTTAAEGRGEGRGHLDHRADREGAVGKPHDTSQSKARATRDQDKHDTRNGRRDDRLGERRHVRSGECPEEQFRDRREGRSGECRDDRQGERRKEWLKDDRVDKRGTHRSDDDRVDKRGTHRGDDDREGSEARRDVDRRGTPAHSKASQQQGGSGDVGFDVRRSSARDDKHDGGRYKGDEREGRRDDREGREDDREGRRDDREGRRDDRERRTGDREGRGDDREGRRNDREGRGDDREGSGSDRGERGDDREVGRDDREGRGSDRGHDVGKEGDVDRSSRDSVRRMEGRGRDEIGGAHRDSTPAKASVPASGHPAEQPQLQQQPPHMADSHTATEPMTCHPSEIDAGMHRVEQGQGLKAWGMSATAAGSDCTGTRTVRAPIDLVRVESKTTNRNKECLQADRSGKAVGSSEGDAKASAGRDALSDAHLEILTRYPDGACVMFFSHADLHVIMKRQRIPLMQEVHPSSDLKLQTVMIQQPTEVTASPHEATVLPQPQQAGQATSDSKLCGTAPAVEPGAAVGHDNQLGFTPQTLLMYCNVEMQMLHGMYHHRSTSLLESLPKDDWPMQLCEGVSTTSPSPSFKTSVKFHDAHYFSGLPVERLIHLKAFKSVVTACQQAQDACVPRSRGTVSTTSSPAVFPAQLPSIHLSCDLVKELWHELVLWQDIKNHRSTRTDYGSQPHTRKNSGSQNHRNASTSHAGTAAGGVSSRSGQGNSSSQPKKNNQRQTGRSGGGGGGAGTARGGTHSGRRGDHDEWADDGYERGDQDHERGRGRARSTGQQGQDKGRWSKTHGSPSSRHNKYTRSRSQSRSRSR